MPFRAVVTKVAIALALACAMGCETYEVPRHVQYVINVYEPGPPVAIAETPEPAAQRATAPGDPRSSGFPACDAYFRRTEECARTITRSGAALARFTRSIDIARDEDRLIAGSTDARAKRDTGARCQAALEAYENSPCSPADLERVP